jgi:hypothetical protein
VDLVLPRHHAIRPDQHQSRPILRSRPRTQCVLDEVGSYGRQIGQISDALDVLLRHVPLENLNKHDRDALTDFRLQIDQVNRLKEKRGRKQLRAA